MSPHGLEAHKGGPIFSRSEIVLLSLDEIAGCQLRYQPVGAHTGKSGQAQGGFDLSAYLPGDGHRVTEKALASRNITNGFAGFE